MLVLNFGPVEPVAPTDRRKDGGRDRQTDRQTEGQTDRKQCI